jgi:hypothetical protein
MKLSVLRYAAIGMATLSLAGFAAASTVSLGTTGPNSSNHVTLSNNNSAQQNNDNNVGAANLNEQAAGSGDVTAQDNTTVGGGLGSTNGSGDVANANGTKTDVMVTNSGLGGDLAMPAASDDSVSFDTTGPNSDNNVKINNDNSVSVNNDNNVDVFNASEQEAVSGNVKAQDNTTVGGLTSGSASNTNTTETDVTIGN